jgi:23S rRNA (cytidine1920-2'-O)/16S rRNA (cytidine1409-2'-O)-methyltransferase
MNDAPATTDRPRLDQYLVELGHYETRSRARDAIARGAVSVDGKPVTKPGAPVSAGAAVAIADPARAYVSRAALKLIAGLDAFGFDPVGRDCLDIGASTGGFSQVLLERGARHVTAIDVGHGQMDPRVAADPRVENREGRNARDLSTADVGNRAIGAIVSDVSFISLKLALPAALDLAASGAFAVLLVKPQFEAGREAIGKGGLLKDPLRGPAIADDLATWLGGQAGWRVTGLVPSPIEGGDGNLEFLLGGVKA